MNSLVKKVMVSGHSLSGSTAFHKLCKCLPSSDNHNYAITMLALNYMSAIVVAGITHGEKGSMGPSWDPLKFPLLASEHYSR